MAQITTALSRFEFHARAGDGLLSRLRPYQGVRSADLEDLLVAMSTLVRAVEEGGMLGPVALDLVYTILWTVRAVAMNDDGMLARNDLIDDQTSKRLTGWMRKMEREFLQLLGGLADNVCSDSK